MRQEGITEGTLYINNRKICSSCQRLLPTMLAPGTTLNVVLPDNTIVQFTGIGPLIVVRYKNQQNESNPMNDIAITSKKELSDLLRARQHNTPFLARLSGDNGFEIMLGIAGQVGCAQHSRSDGSLPYLMAHSTNPSMTNGDVEFLTADTPTPVQLQKSLVLKSFRASCAPFP